MNTTFFRQIGPYEIQHAIGRGGMGHVFLARDTRPGGPTVALKIVPDGPDADTRDAAAAEQRGADLQRIFLDTSPYVPRVYDVDRADGYLYIAMEYVEGEDLSAIIRRGPIDPQRAAAIADYRGRARLHLRPSSRATAFAILSVTPSRGAGSIDRLAKISACRRGATAP